MTIEEYKERIKKLADEMAQKAVKAIIVPAANELLATVKNRIVIDGKNSQDKSIGAYSTKEAYFEQSKFDKKSAFKPVGKNGTDKVDTFNVGTRKKTKTAVTSGQRPRKTMYIETGYKGLRDIQGKPTDNIKANYTGSTMASYQQSVKDNTVLQGMINERASIIRKGLEKQKTQDIYKPTQDELNQYNANVAKASKELQAKILKGVSI